MMVRGGKLASFGGFPPSNGNTLGDVVGLVELVEKGTVGVFWFCESVGFGVIVGMSVGAGVVSVGVVGAGLADGFEVGVGVSVGLGVGICVMTKCRILGRCSEDTGEVRNPSEPTTHPSFELTMLIER
jgi:hypothetical protein